MSDQTMVGEMTRFEQLTADLKMLSSDLPAAACIAALQGSALNL
jgi:hypothetical protein